MFTRLFPVLFLLFIPSFIQAQAFDADARAAAIAPYLDEQAFVVAHIDPSKIDLAAARKMIAEKLPVIPKESLAELEREEAQASKYLAELKKAGIADAYLVISLADVPARPPFFVVRTAPRGDVERLKKLLLAGPQNFDKDDTIVAGVLTAEVIHGNICIGHPNSVARVKEMEKPAEKKDLAQAFKVAGDTAVQIVLLQSEDTRRVLTETLPKLPGDLSDYSGMDLAAIKYAAIGIDLPPKLAVRVGVQTDNEASATVLRKLATDGLALIGKQVEIKELLPKFDEIATVLTPKQTGDRLSLMLNEENGGIAKTLSLLTPPVQAARKAAQRAQSSNNLKQMALAMHIHHDAAGAFPPAATTKDGKSLLSWRVQILPYIEQDALYKEFHHDEPWDSDHNKKLIEKMPKVYSPPFLTLKPGETTYLVPTGKGMVFNGDTKNKFANITDGTSNTIMLVEADADQAVPWTKPDDLAVDLDKPLAGLGGVWGDGFLVALCDGSVRFVTNKIDLKTLANLFQMSDGNPVPGF